MLGKGERSKTPNIEFGEGKTGATTTCFQLNLIELPLYLKWKVKCKMFRGLFILRGVYPWILIPLVLMNKMEMAYNEVHEDEIPSVEHRTVSPLFNFSPELSVTVRKNRPPFLWTLPHITTTTTTAAAYCWCKALKAGIPTMLSLREATNPPTVQPLAGSQTGQALNWKDYTYSPSCAIQAKRHQDTRELGQMISKYKNGPL